MGDRASLPDVSSGQAGGEAGAGFDASSANWPAPAHHGLALPSVSLPKGGGAIRGLGESFTAAAATGTGSFTVPIPTSPGRAGSGPQLSLSYDSGSGNGPFGFGWSLSTPSITRKTDKGLPRYDDERDGDCFMLSGAGELVPARVSEQAWARDQLVDPPHAPGYRIDRYRPRVEGLFARVERWTRIEDGDAHWRVTSGDNVTTWYGEDESSRIADPADAGRVFTWLISRVLDDKGNAIVYGYEREDAASVDLTAANERHRTMSDRGVNRYLKRIHYGNRTSHLVDPALEDLEWMFEVVFDYGDHEGDAPGPQPSRPWPCRADPFSSYRPGFEVRTYRLCRRVLMFHHFPGEDGVGAECLVRSTSFDYEPGDAVGSFLVRVRHAGHRRDGAAVVTRALPPLELGYSTATLRDEVTELTADDLEGVPAGVAAPGYQWADLDGDGLNGILAEQAGGWFYKENLGGGRFSPPRLLPSVPSVAGPGGRRHQLLDLAGDGHLDVVVLGGPVQGFHERTSDRDWGAFEAFAHVPALDWDDPNLRFVDLDGDGHADVLLTEQDVFTWYPSLGERGFDAGRRVSVPADEERGPRLVFAESAQSIHLADMTGDGLADLVRIRNGEVCYWPNLGYGRFGAKVEMDDAPWFDHEEQFHPRYLRLADIDGSGVADLLYFGSDGARLWLNRSGNGWATERAVPGAPRGDARAHVAAVDLFGSGTACLVWSSDDPADGRRSLRCLDLLGSEKPHLLIRVDNNLGAETHIRYAPSTRFFLADKAAGRPWRTRLPFPVHVVERVETHDRISRGRFVSRYAYHHGCFDGHEREFRGFGMVERWDTEELAALGVTPGAANEDPASYSPPVLTRTWYHTGTPDPGGKLARAHESDYWTEPGLDDAQRRALLLDDASFPDGVVRPDGSRRPHEATGEEWRQAARALKGAVLREEVYALDGSSAEGLPYTVTETGHAVELLQPLHREDRDAVFLVHSRERLACHYERARYPVEGLDGAIAELCDPRVSHDLTLRVDGWGNITRSVAIAYPRRRPDVDPLLPQWAGDAVTAAQAGVRVTMTEHDFTDAVSGPLSHRAPLGCETRTWELIDLPITDVGGVPGLYYPAELDALADELADGAADVAYDDLLGERADGPDPHRRLIEHTRTLYRADDLSGPLPLGGLGSLGLPYESRSLALTPGLLAKVYRRPTGDGGEDDLLPDPAAELQADGGYVYGSQGWWSPSGRVSLSADPAHSPAQELAYARAHFFLPCRLRDPYGNTSTVVYDHHDLLPQEQRDPLGNVVTAGERAADGSLAAQGNDYRVLQPWLITDPNGNRTAARFDALGMVVATAVMGKSGEDAGDLLGDTAPELSAAALAAAVADGFVHAADLLGTATTRMAYDLWAYHRTRGGVAPEPPAVWTLARETHESDLPDGTRSRVRRSVAYSDGLGRAIQSRRYAGAGPLEDGGPAVTARWSVSSWTIQDNKGRTVRRYEPFFAADHAFTFGAAVGVSTVYCHDPLGRVVATVHPNHTFEKVVVDPWRQEQWDPGDTVLLDPAVDPVAGPYVRRLPAAEYQPSWHQSRTADPLNAAVRAAARRAEVYAGTPAVTLADPLGRVVVAVAHNRADGDDGPVDALIATWTQLDVEGNERRVVDPAGRLVAESSYDLLGTRLRHDSMEGGSRWRLPTATGETLLEWDSRGHAQRTRYDALRRQTAIEVTEPGAPGPVEVMRTSYGEEQADAADRNLRGRVHQLRDQAGVATNLRYGFKGELRESERVFAAEYRATIDWSGAVLLSGEVFTQRVDVDALGRVVAAVGPDRTVERRAYDELGHLRRVTANVRGAALTTVVLAHAEYNARGQRTRAEYGNDVVTTWRYDDETFLLSRIQTLREGGFVDDCPDPDGDFCGVQDLRYTYDPVGNVTQVADRAQQTLFFRNRRVDPDVSYTYDAVYRLVEATGREHLGQVAAGLRAPTPPRDGDAPRRLLPHPADGNAMGRYTEQYRYDDAGNLLEVAHRGTDPQHAGWKRTYRYEEASQLEPARRSNRLTSTRLGSGAALPYAHDAHGNMIAMPHLTLMAWDHRDELCASSRQAVNAGTPETTHYRYDGGGDRVRVVTDPQAAADATPLPMRERLTVGALDVHREYAADGETVVLERQTVHVMDGDRRIALVETRTVGDDPGARRLVRYQLDNHLGSVGLELDGSGRIISYEEYYPHGATAFQAVASQTQAPKRFRYCGKERDEETGLARHGARYYAPWLGRWTSADPAGLRDGPNLYRYTSGNPISFQDPDGREEKVGTILTHRKHGEALKEAGKRISEDEHVIPRASQEAVTRNPTTGQSDYKGRHYQNNTTVRVERQMALEKTHGGPTSDNRRSAALKQKAAAGAAIDVNQELLLDSLDNAKRARSVTSSVITDSDLHKAGLAQMGELFEIDGHEGRKKAELVWDRISDDKLKTEQESLQRAAEASKKGPVKQFAPPAAGSESFADVLDDTPKSKAVSQAVETGGKTLTKLGTKALKVVPFVGIGAGLYSVKAEAAQGNYGTAALEAVGLVPVVGDVVDAARLGVAVGEAGAEALGIGDVAFEHGTAVEGAAKGLGLGTDAARVIGATGAAVSSITVAPYIAAKRKIASWFN